MMPAVRLFVGGHAGTVQGEPQNLAGDRCFSAVYAPPLMTVDPAQMHVLLDSGAFSDAPSQRLTPAGALERQLSWLDKAESAWGGRPAQVSLCSYDVLIDEQWTDNRRRKERWSVADGFGAVEQTVNAAHYLASQRGHLSHRLVLSLQGVDAAQYEQCARAVLPVATPADWIGFGGWCIIGRHQRMLPLLWETARRVLPLVVSAGISHVHIFGVLWEPALAGLLWLCDRYGLTLSTDSTAPLLACTRGNLRKAGARRPYWRDNVNYWITHLAHLRTSCYYREPPRPAEQLSFDLKGAAA